MSATLRTFILREPEHARSLWQFLKAHAAEWAAMGKPLAVKVSEHADKRTNDQNEMMWALLGAVSEQVVWYGKKLSAEDWKNVFSASLRKLDVVPNLDGTGFVALGQSTSRMTKKEFSDLIELIQSFAAERGVVLPRDADVYAPTLPQPGSPPPRALAG